VIVAKQLINPTIDKWDELVHLPALIQAWYDELRESIEKGEYLRTVKLLRTYKENLLKIRYTIWYGEGVPISLTVDKLPEYKIEKKIENVDCWIEWWTLVVMGCLDETPNQSHTTSMFRTIFEICTEWGANKVVDVYDEDYYVIVSPYISIQTPKDIEPVYVKTKYHLFREAICKVTDSH
jgi:hypothetical protein